MHKQSDYLKTKKNLKFLCIMLDMQPSEKKQRFTRKQKMQAKEYKKMQNRAKFRAPHSIEKCYTRLSLED